MINTLIKHKDKIILMKLALLQISISFFTNFFIVKKIGFTDELDIFYLAMGVYLFLTTSIGWSISSVLTPILIENEDKKIEGAMFINIVIISFSFFCLLILSSFFWIDFMFKNYIETVDRKLILDIQIIFLFVFLFDVLNILFIAILQQKNKYILINFVTLLSSIISFIFIYLFIDDYLLYAATFSQLISRITIFIVLGIFLFSVIIGRLNFQKDIFLLLWNRMKYFFYSSFYFRSGDLIDKFITSYLSSGFLSLTSFIQKLYEAVNTVINSSIVAPTITKFSYLVKEKKFRELKILIKKYLILLFIINTINLIIIIIFGEKFFLYFFSEKIEYNLIPILSSVLIAIFTICFSQTIGKILQNFLLSLEKEKQIIKYDIYTFTISIFIKIILTYYFSIIGFLFSFVITEVIKYGTKSYLVYKLIKGYK